MIGSPLESVIGKAVFPTLNFSSLISTLRGVRRPDALAFFGFNLNLRIFRIFTCA